jgi:hypothetical protein
MFRLLLTFCILTAAALPARAEWVRSTELTYRTAYTLQPGELEVGILSPLQFGVSERVQLGIHPILLLVGAINASFRWRITDESKIAVATDLDASLSLLAKEDTAGNPVSDAGCPECGYPSRIRATMTVSFQLGPKVLLSVGGGVAVDLVDLTFARFLAEAHASLIWRISQSQLLMLHGSGYIEALGDGAPSLPNIQLMYAVSCGGANLGLGIAVGDFPVARTLQRIQDWVLYPVLDIWWRF